MINLNKFSEQEVNSILIKTIHLAKESIRDFSYSALTYIVELTEMTVFH